MKKIDIEITGEAPLIQNRYPIEDEGQNKSRAKKQVREPVAEAKKCLYQRDGKIFEPSEHIFQSIVRTGSDFKLEGRKNYKKVLAAGLFVEPEEIPIISEKPYEIDMRMVVIPATRGRVPKYRPMWRQWKLSFKITILDDANISTSLLKEVLEKAGKSSGIGDYRPRYGRFTITSWQEVK